MTRRTWLTSAAAAAAAAGAQSKRNVLFIVSDDLNSDVGREAAAVKTPNFDRLAARGVRFDRAYCQYPLCNPSRSSFFSGLRPETTGVLDQKTVVSQKRPDAVLMPDFFRQHGYYAAAAGKAFHLAKPFAKSWDKHESGGKHEGEAAAIHRRYNNPENSRTPDWAQLTGDESTTIDATTAANAIAAMEQCASERKPFFVVAGFVKPHLPWAVPQRYFDMHRPAAPPEEPAMRDIPSVALMTELFGHKPPANRAEAIRAYRAATTFMDAQLGKLLDTLDRLKLWDSTTVVFLGDNGFHLGEHGLWSKHTLFERATRVPLVVASPEGARAKTCARMVELLDVYPTLAELASLPAPKHLQGRSLAPLLRNPAAAWDRPARSVVLREDGRFGASVRTDRWRYTEWEGASELYDHRADPGEYTNLAGDSKYAPVVRELAPLLPKRK